LMGTGTHEDVELNGEPAHTSASETLLAKRDASRPSSPLTPRELEILGLLVRGQTNRQIARTLLISVSTVKRHVRHIGEKLGAQDRVQAAVRAVELGLLDERTGG
jgi:DNA-binding NarL/FixJ family response regulator